jgi:hypothetical protein
LNLRGDDDPGEAELDGAALELGPCLARIECRDVRVSNEAAGMILFDWCMRSLIRRQVARFG